MIVPEWLAVILVSAALSLVAWALSNINGRVTRLEREAVLKEELKQAVSHIHEDNQHIRARVDTIYDSLINGGRGG